MLSDIWPVSLSDYLMKTWWNHGGFWQFRLLRKVLCAFAVSVNFYVISSAMPDREIVTPRSLTAREAEIRLNIRVETIAFSSHSKLSSAAVPFCNNRACRNGHPWRTLIGSNIGVMMSYGHLSRSECLIVWLRLIDYSGDGLKNCLNTISLGEPVLATFLSMWSYCREMSRNA